MLIPSSVLDGQPDAPSPSVQAYRPAASPVTTALALLAAVAVYLATAVPQLGRPLIYDEVDFAKASQAVATGTFRYDRGYIADYEDAADAGQRFQDALWHPPGYLMALAAWQQWLPGGDPSLRTFGLLCGLLTLGATAALAGWAAGPRAAGLAAILWSTSPYAVQSALLLDIDGTVLAPLVAVLALLALRATAPDPAPPGALRWVLVGASFALALWCKLSTPLVVAGALLVWLVACRRWTAAAGLGLSCLAGALLFSLTWLLVAAAAGVPAARPLEATWHAVLEVAGHGSATASSIPPILVALVAALRSAQWLHPLSLCLLVATPLALRRRDAGGALLVLAALGAAVALAKLAAGFPKYQAGTWPLVVAVLAAALARWLASPRGHAAPWLMGGAMAGAGATVLLGSDALIRAVELRHLALWLGAAAAALAGARWLGPRRTAATVLGLLLGANLATGLHLARSPGSTTYFFGARGQVEAGTWLGSARALPGCATCPDGAGPAAVADREVAYYAGAVHFVDTERFLDSLSSQAPAVVGTAGGAPVVISRHPALAARLPPSFRPWMAFGDYQVWVRQEGETVCGHEGA
ncbi:MAG TPA: glycosyltransferase family 39 protein [Chloroflexota bacterium]|nr:glycosyltransferase family 39 protein [Chloroflexota bacterium]